MSAITVPAFYDVDCFSNQNRRNHAQQHHGHQYQSSMVQHKAVVGTPITGNIRHHANTSSSRNHMLERSMSEPADKNANTTSMSQMHRTSGPATAATGGPANVNSSRYKTELCRPFEENGYCKYGDKCQFAHGHHELRSLARHPKYKTELCRTFHTIGFCPYGPRCHFIHNEEERKGHHDGPPSSQPTPPPSASGVVLMGGSVSPPGGGNKAGSRRHPYPLNLPLVRDSLGSTADSPTSSVTDSPIMSPTFVGDNDMLSCSFSSGGPFSQPPPMSAPPLTRSTGGGMGGSAFSFHDLSGLPPAVSTTLLSPLNIHTADPIASLTADLQAVVSLTQRHNNSHNNMLTSLQQHKQHPVQALFGLAGLSHSATGLVNLVEHMIDNTVTVGGGVYGGAPPSPPDSVSGDSSSSCSSMSSSSMCGSPLDVSRGLRLPIFTTLSNE